MWRWWRKKPAAVTKNLTGLSVLTDEHLEYLGRLYEQEPEYGLIKNRISFGRYVELAQKIQWEV